MSSNDEVLNSHFFSKTSLDTFSKQNPGSLILIYFTATWCGPCKQIAPFFNSLKETYKNKSIIFKKIDVDDDEHSDLCEELSISAMPTFKFIRNGVILNTIVGNDEEGISNLLNTIS